MEVKRLKCINEDLHGDKINVVYSLTHTLTNQKWVGVTMTKRVSECISKYSKASKKSETNISALLREFPFYEFELKIEFESDDPKELINQRKRLVDAGDTINSKASGVSILNDPLNLQILNDHKLGISNKEISKKYGILMPAIRSRLKHVKRKIEKQNTMFDKINTILNEKANI